MELDFSTLSIPQRISALAVHGAVSLLIVWVITRFLRAIAPSRQPPELDERFLAVQRRLFFGSTPFGRYRTSGVGLYFRVIIAACWIFYFLQLALLVVAAV